MIKLILTSSLILITSSTIAQVEQIESDRPGKTNTPSTVPKKWVQGEIGFLKETEKFFPSLKDTYLQHPSLLTKYGISNRLELRLITELATIKEENVNGTVIYTGIKSVQLGGKLNFLKERGVVPKISLIAHYDFHGLRTIIKGKDSIDGANFRFALQNTISDNLLVVYNIGMEWDRFGLPPTYIYTLSPRFNISEKWIAFIEVFGFIWKNEIPKNSIDGGIIYYIYDNFKIDASIGFGLNKKAPDNFFSIGSSFRFNSSK